ncbi:hypothetical protein MTOK_16040 [Mycolicibacterium tokaiense]|nr:hypothetical protein MTOK_16040 [Mycolicibacterium tokaiense]
MQVSGAVMDMKREKPHELWLPAFDVHFPAQMSRRCPVGHESGIFRVPRFASEYAHVVPGSADDFSGTTRRTRVFGISKYVTAPRKESVRRSRATTRLDKARNDFTADLKMFTLRTQLERLES